MAPSSSPEPCSLARLLAYFLCLGTFGFGGPIALAARMDRDLVEERGWVSRQDYVEGLAFSQLSPGPLAAQLAMYIGWVRAGRLGAALVAGAFIAPSFLMAVAVAADIAKTVAGIPATLDRWPKVAEDANTRSWQLIADGLQIWRRRSPHCSTQEPLLISYNRIQQNTS